jgi:branched-subunit amino acid permease
VLSLHIGSFLSIPRPQQRRFSISSEPLTGSLNQA